MAVGRVGDGLFHPQGDEPAGAGFDALRYSTNIVPPLACRPRSDVERPAPVDQAPPIDRIALCSDLAGDLGKGFVMKFAVSASAIVFAVYPFAARSAIAVGSAKTAVSASAAKSTPRPSVQAGVLAKLSCQKAPGDHARITNTSSFAVQPKSMIDLRTAGKDPKYGSSHETFTTTGIAAGATIEAPGQFNPEFVTCIAKVLK